MHTPPEGANSLIYTILVYLHILSTIIAVGYNFAYTIWIRRGTANPEHLDFALRGVKFMDDYIANPCYLLLAVTGFLMIAMGKPIASFLWVAIGIYVIAMIVAYGVYTPLLSRQIKMLEAKGPSDPLYLTIARRSNLIGAGMGLMVVLIIALKIFEPTFWS